MDKHSDLILDSKLNTRFESVFTVHSYREVSHNAERRVVVQREEYWRQIEHIGSGAYGSVWLEKCVQDHRDGALRAIKKVSTRPSRSGREKDYSQELKAVAKFSHDKYVHCFVKSFGWYEGEDSLFIAMEYLPHGDLQQYLSRMPPVLEEATGNVIHQILEGLSYMHGNNFAHRDLKPGNILIESCPPRPWWVKIGDFGISKRLEDATAQSTLLKGTLGFIAPELHGFISGGTPFAADMWSLGEITFRLITKQPVFKNNGLLARYAMQSDPFPSADLLTHNVSTSGRDFISSLMVALPGMRLTAEAALKHQWIESYLSLAVQPSPLSQTTSSLPATDPTTEVLASWNSLSISDAPLPDFDKTLRPGNTENHQSADHCTVRPSLIEDVSRQVTRPEKFTHIRELRGHTGIVQSVAFSPDGATIASGSNDMSVRIWDASMGRQLQELKGHTGSVYSVAFSPNGATIVSGSADCSVRTWDTSTGRQLWEKPRAHASAVQSVAFSPKGTTIASAERSKNGSVKIWDTSTGRLLRELSVLGSFCAIAFSPKWATIASGEKSSNGSVRIWDARTGRQLRKLKGHNSGVKCLAFSPDGTTIASASGPGDCHMRIWDTSTGRQLWKHAFNWGFFGSVAFSPDGATIASGYTEGSTKGVLSIWDASTGERLQRKFSCHASSIDSVAFSPDGTTLVSGSTDGLVRIWDIYQV